MKKVMFGFAALAATVAMADIQSANTVGFQTLSLESNKKTLTAVQFGGVGGGALDIQSISCKDGSDEAGDGAFRLWWYDVGTESYVYAVYSNDIYVDDGSDTEYTDVGYYWLDEESGYAMLPAGYKVKSDAAATTTSHAKTFAPGDGVFIMPNSGVADAKVTLAGEVLAADAEQAYISFDCESNKKQILSNPFPAALDIQSIVCKDGTDEAGDGAFRLWWYDVTAETYIYAVYSNDIYVDDGLDTEYTDVGYYWLDEDSGYAMLPAGYKVKSDADATTTSHAKSFAAGEAFFVMPNSGVADAKVKFPNLNYKGE